MSETTTKRVLLTGATGFLGQAVLERLLSSGADAYVTAVIRPKGEITAPTPARSCSWGTSRASTRCR